jgi:DNA-binding beta-propeller fold protein YncE
VSVIDGATCNGHTGRGCGRTPASVTVGASPSAVAVDRATDTVYVADYVNEFNGGSVSVINGARCNARTTAGCGDTPPAVPTGIGTGSAAVDQALHTVFAVNQGDNTLSAINARTCNGKVTSGCHRRPPNQQAAAPGHGPGYNPGPSAFALLQRTGTAYVVNIGGVNILSVTSVRRCNAITTAGCRAEAPAVPEHESLLSADPATGTIYASNLSLPQIDVINSATCRAGRHTGCAPVAEIPVKDPQANVGAVDHGSHTLYAADPFADTVYAPNAGAGFSGDTVSVINGAACNGTDHSGCGHLAATVMVGRGPFGVAVNDQAHAVYVTNNANGDSPGTLSVINSAACNGTHTTGCQQHFPTMPTGRAPLLVAADAHTSTVYVTDFESAAVTILTGSPSRPKAASDCRTAAREQPTGSGPFGIAVDDRAHTVYVANGYLPGSLSIVGTTPG